MKGTEISNEADIDAIIGIGWLLEKDVCQGKRLRRFLE